MGKEGENKEKEGGDDGIKERRDGKGEDRGRSRNIALSRLS